MIQWKALKVSKENKVDIYVMISQDIHELLSAKSTLQSTHSRVLFFFLNIVYTPIHIHIWETAAFIYTFLYGLNLLQGSMCYFCNENE